MASPEDVERAGIAAYLEGRDTDATELLIQAHNAWIAQGQPTQAARTTFWIGFVLTNRGERAQAAGWFARGRRLVEHTPDSVAHGYLLLPVAREHAEHRDFAAAAVTCEEAARIGETFRDADLVQFARHLRGRFLIGLGRTAEGVSLLDEVMVAVTAGELSPIAAGTIYCSVISACFDVLDIRRAQEWTDALDRWCRSRPGLVAYRGQCLVHRAEIMLLHGLWPEAVLEARRACECVGPQSLNTTAGAALYQLAELHRLRGDLAEAEHQYMLAAQAGRSPQPGLGLVRLAQGRPDAARAAIAGALTESRDRRTRATLLAAFADVALSTDDVESARGAAAELSVLAGTAETAFIRARSLQSNGAVLLHQGDADAALPPLRDARAIWRDLEVPYEEARTTALIARACRALNDVDGARIEAEAANRIFARLGSPDVCSLAAAGKAVTEGHSLSAREIEVLKLIATGQTNRAIAESLAISEKTVARHVSNIFVKLNLSTRSAATAYAFKHQLI